MFKRLLPKSEFVRNSIKLISGTAFSQAILLAITPILTRIYSPEDFGVFALYTSIVSITSIIITGRYEMAIILPKKDNDAINLLALSFLISVVLSIISLIVIFIFNERITDLFNNQDISSWLYFIPISLLTTGCYQSFYYWNNRTKFYGNISKSSVVKSSVVGSTNLTVGWLFSGPLGLLVGNVLGLLASVIYLFRNSKYIKIQNVDRIKIVEMARRYKNFPIYDAPASIFNIASHQSAHIFFNTFFGAIVSGHYYLTQKILGMPIQLIGTSIQSVFRQKVMVIHNEKGNTRNFFLLTLRYLILLAILPTFLMYYFAIDIFEFVFGEEWGQTGEFVRILLPVFFFRFISFPLSSMIYVAEKQHVNVVGQFTLLISIVICFFIGKDVGAEYTLQLISIASSIFYLAYLFLSFTFTSKGTNY